MESSGRRISRGRKQVYTVVSPLLLPFVGFNVTFRALPYFVFRRTVSDMIVKSHSGSWLGGVLKEKEKEIG